MCKNNDYVLDDEAKDKIHMYFEQQISLKDENFENGILVRNLYDDLVMNHARRVINITNPGSEELSTQRVDGKLVLPEAIKVLQMAAK